MYSQATKDAEMEMIKSTNLIPLALIAREIVGGTYVMMVTRKGSARPATLKKYYGRQLGVTVCDILLQDSLWNN